MKLLIPNVFPNFNGCAPPLKFEKISNFIPHFMMNLIIHTFCNLSSLTYIKGGLIYHLSELWHISIVYQFTVPWYRGCRGAERRVYKNNLVTYFNKINNSFDLGFNMQNDFQSGRRENINIPGGPVTQGMQTNDAWAQARAHLASERSVVIVILDGKFDLLLAKIICQNLHFGKYVRWSCLSVCLSFCLSVCLYGNFTKSQQRVSQSLPNFVRSKY